MSNRVSRRNWLIAIMAGAATATPLWSEEPSDRLANTKASEWMPPPSRSIRLTDQPTVAPVITAIAVDPRGELVAVAGDDHLIRILATSNLQTIRTLSGHRDLIRSMTFDPNGDRLASVGNDGQLLLWERDQSFRMKQRLAGTPSLSCVKFSPDGEQLAAVGFGRDVYLLGDGPGFLSDDTGPIPTFQCAATDLRAVAFRDDSNLIAVGGRSGEISLFDPSDGSSSCHPLHEGRIHGIAFHYHSNQAICVADDGYLSVFNTRDKTTTHKIAVTTGKLFAVATINSQLVAVAGSDNLIRIVNTDEGKVIRRLEGHSGSVAALAAGSGLLFSGSYDTTLRRWSIDDIARAGQRIAEGDPRIDR